MGCVERSRNGFSHT